MSTTLASVILISFGLAITGLLIYMASSLNKEFSDSHFDLSDILKGLLLFALVVGLGVAVIWAFITLMVAAFQ